MAQDSGEGLSKREQRKLEREAKRNAKKKKKSGDDEDDKDKKKKKKKADKRAVIKAIKDLDLLDGKVGNGKYFMYAQVDSLSTESNDFVDELNKKQKDYKRAGAGILLICHIATKEEANEFLKRRRNKLGAIMASDKMLGETLPGYSSNSSTPNVTIVDGTGKVITSGSTSAAQAWLDEQTGGSKKTETTEEENSPSGEE